MRKVPLEPVLHFPLLLDLFVVHLLTFMSRRVYWAIFPAWNKGVIRKCIYVKWSMCSQLALSINSSLTCYHSWNALWIMENHHEEAIGNIFVIFFARAIKRILKISFFRRGATLTLFIISIGNLKGSRCNK